MSETIVGQVAQVTSDRELILNRGSDHGVTEGLRFLVKDSAVEVTDPETDEVLGSVAPVKVVVRAEEVHPRFCIARTFRTKRIKVEEAQPGNPTFAAMKASLGAQLQPPRPARYETRVETLRYDPEQGQYMSEIESLVRRGDQVESVADDEEIDPVTTTLFR